MQKEEIFKLLQKYNAGTCNDEEKAIIESWYLQYEDSDLDDLSDMERKEDLDQIWASLPVHEKERGYDFTFITRIAAAATILIVLSISTWFLLNKPSINHEVAGNIEKQGISPGNNKATLILADGSIIKLDDAKNGEIAKQAGITILKTAEGQLVYSIAKKPEIIAGNIMNTIETPRGGQYQINLPDGTKVWLNAASSLRFPTVFTGKEREVELTGEAYFEVAHNKNKPFKVMSNNQLVEVLGTHFNINSYSDELLSKTTLLEGSVRISNLTSAASNLLVPGQQAVLSGGKMKIAKANLEEVVAWKNGYIVFENEKITSIMKKVSRWYDVEIVYEGKITDNDFNGSVSRFENVSKLLEVLELTQTVHFKLEGRRIVVMP